MFIRLIRLLRHCNKPRHVQACQTANLPDAQSKTQWRLVKHGVSISDLRHLAMLPAAELNLTGASPMYLPR